MIQATEHEIELVIFDVDDTLLYCLDKPPRQEIALSDRGSGPGNPTYTFETNPDTDLQIRRNDGVRFELFPEVPEVLRQLKDAGIGISLASFNYSGPVFRALEAFGILDFFYHPVVAWTPRKDLMLELILASVEQERFVAVRHCPEVMHKGPVAREQVLFVDDSAKYRESAEKAGVCFWHLTSNEELRNILAHVVSDKP